MNRGKIIDFILKIISGKQRKRPAVDIAIHNVDSYEIPFLYTHNLSSLYAYPIINHGDEFFRSGSCMPNIDIPFIIENEVLKHSIYDKLGVLLHYVTGDRFCSIYGYVLDGLYNWNNSHRVVFFKGFALDCIIHRFPEAVGACTVVVKNPLDFNVEYGFTYIITDKIIPKKYNLRSCSIDLFKESRSSNLTNLRRLDIVLIMLSEYFGYSFDELCYSFNWNNLFRYKCNSTLEQDILNYLYPKIFHPIYSEEEICFSEFVNNCICIANVNAYNYRMDADTIDKNYNRVVNYIKAYPHFINKISKKYYNSVSRAFYYTAYHFDDAKINDDLFLIAYYMLSKAIEYDNNFYLYFFRSSLIEERFLSATSSLSFLHLDILNLTMEEIVEDMELADFLYIKMKSSNVKFWTDDIGIRCTRLISERYVNFTVYEIYQKVSLVRNCVIDSLFRSFEPMSFIFFKDIK